MANLNSLFNLDHLSIFMLALVNYVCIIVAVFARNHLAGDRNCALFFKWFPVLVLSLNCLVTADHIILFLGAWGISNFVLGRLMGYNSPWKAAHEAAVLAYKTFTFGFVCLAAALLSLAYYANSLSIQTVLTVSLTPGILMVILSLILIAAMTQSALWPFHKWLTSSLNSPTPASAVMHAGLVNGGGFLLTRLSPLYSHDTTFLTIIFALGIITAIVGTLWKLMQSDYKRMLACSTMGQMGFMVVQCGLGLFPAAVAHLCWHGLYKAYMFLGSGSAAQEQRLDPAYPVKFRDFILSFGCGLAGTVVFATIAYPGIDGFDTRLILLCVAAIAGTQLALPLVRRPGGMGILLGLGATLIGGGMYGLSVYLVELLLGPLNLAQAYTLNGIHLVGIGGIVLSWLGLLFVKLPETISDYPAWVLKIYVRSLNGGQPHKKTITTHRNHYTDK